jgi:hypothetical protein
MTEVVAHRCVVERGCRRLRWNTVQHAAPFGRCSRQRPAVKLRTSHLTTHVVESVAPRHLISCQDRSTSSPNYASGGSWGAMTFAIAE